MHTAEYHSIKQALLSCALRLAKNGRDQELIVLSLRDWENHHSRHGVVLRLANLVESQLTEQEQV